MGAVNGDNLRVFLSEGEQKKVGDHRRETWGQGKSFKGGRCWCMSESEGMIQHSSHGETADVSGESAAAGVK